MTEKKRCELCGDDFHETADTQEWLGLYCPGAAASVEDQQAYRSALAITFAQYWEAEVRHFFDWEDGREERNAAWDTRQRADGLTKAELPEVARTSTALAADCVVRTESELDRQRRDEIFAPYGGFDVDIAHLTVPGQVPIRPAMVRTKKEKLCDPTDQLLFLGDDDE